MTDQPDTQAEAATPEPLCEHRCLLPDGHNEAHQHGYSMPSDRDQIAAARQDIEWMRKSGEIRSLWMSATDDIMVDIEDGRPPHWRDEYDELPKHRLALLRRFFDGQVAQRTEIDRLQCEVELAKNAALPDETRRWKQAAIDHHRSAERWAKEWAESDDRERAARSEIKWLRVVLELGYRATEARNLLAAASDDWGTTPMLSEFHERAGEILWPEGPPS